MYPWFKALHLIFVIAWFAGLFYIFRLFVYHIKYGTRADIAEIYRIMERRLMYAIMYPAMFLSLGFGGILLYQYPFFLYQRWMQAKLILVALLLAYHLFCDYTRHRFARDDYFLSETACRVINEVPTIFLIVLVILAVVKPLLMP